ncbi:uncharacterized protein O3C94_006874 [Discoglossus pictus]
MPAVPSRCTLAAETQAVATQDDGDSSPPQVQEPEGSAPTQEAGSSAARTLGGTPPRALTRIMATVPAMSWRPRYTCPLMPPPDMRMMGFQEPYDNALLTGPQPMWP